MKKAPSNKCRIGNYQRPTWGYKDMCQAHLQRAARSPHIPMEHPLTQTGNWKGGNYTDRHGRTLTHSPGHPHPTQHGTHVYRYRLVMEKHLGRFLLPAEVVHHRNGDCTDDRLDNLEIMTRSEHARHHRNEVMAGRWAVKHQACLGCGTTTERHQGLGYCRPCYNLHRRVAA